MMTEADIREHYRALVRQGWTLSQGGDTLDEELFLLAWKDGQGVDMMRQRENGEWVLYVNVRIGPSPRR